MKAGEVFLGRGYATLLAEGKTELPDEAKEGPYALGQMIIVAAESMGADFRLPELPEWFPARVCLPPDVEGQWYRWYDPFIWYETETAIHIESESAPANMSYVGRLWSPGYRPESTDAWAYPIDVWRRLFAEATG